MKNTPTRLTEPRLPPLKESEWNKEQEQLLTLIKQNSKSGRIINLYTTMIRHPELCVNLGPLLTHIGQISKIPDREKEILILRTGWLCYCEYEFGHHTLTGKQAGLKDEEILRITKEPDAPGWDAFDAVLIRAADELHNDAFITNETWQALARKYDEKQIFDLIVTVGTYNLVCMALNSCGVQGDPGVPGFPDSAEK